MSCVIDVLRDGGSALPFRSMTFPAMRGLLDFTADRPAALALAAREGDRPAGLLLAVPGAAPYTAEVLSVFVEEDLRRRGVAEALVTRAKDALRALRVRRVSGTYMSGQASTPAVERLLAKTGWEPPVTRMMVVRCTLDSIRAAPWLHRYQLPPGYEIVPWIEVTASERERIRASNVESPWIAPDLVPFDHEAGIEPITSMALRVDGEILGWCLNHVVDGLLRFTCSFVRRDLQRLGRVVLLYSAAVARAPQAGMSLGSWTIPVAHAGMVAFATRHMKPYSVFFGETRGVSLDLGPAAPEGSDA